MIAFFRSAPIVVVIGGLALISSPAGAKSASSFGLFVPSSLSSSSSSSSSSVGRSHNISGQGDEYGRKIVAETTRLFQRRQRRRRHHHPRDDHNSSLRRARRDFLAAGIAVASYSSSGGALLLPDPTPGGGVKQPNHHHHHDRYRNRYYYAEAIAPEEASRSYDTYAATYDDLDGGNVASSLGIDDARRNLLRSSSCRGKVLEVGAGTGLNLESYRFSEEEKEEEKGGGGGVESLTLVDISEGMLSRARLRAEDRRRTMMAKKDGVVVPVVEFVRADATSELASLFGENSFDTVVDTFSLCVMGNEGAMRCLSEMARVVKRGEDGGRILLIENTRASNPLLGYYQDITASAAADVGGKGCVYNQNVGEMIRRTSGLEIIEEESFAAGLFRSFTCQKT